MSEIAQLTNTLILFVTIMFTVVGVEFLLLILTEPSNRSSRRIFGIELPPMRVIPKKKIDEIGRDRFYAAQKVGTGITWGDWLSLRQLTTVKPPIYGVNNQIHKT